MCPCLSEGTGVLARRSSWEDRALALEPERNRPDQIPRSAELEPSARRGWGELGRGLDLGSETEFLRERGIGMLKIFLILIFRGVDDELGSMTCV